MTTDRPLFFLPEGEVPSSLRREGTCRRCLCPPGMLALYSGVLLDCLAWLGLRRERGFGAIPSFKGINKILMGR